MKALVAALTFYCLGATFFEAFVNYRTWPLLEGADFTRYHAALTKLVIAVMLLPIAVTYALSVTLLWRLRSGLVIASVVLQSIAIASSLVVQIPLQMKLRTLGPAPDLIARLLWTDLAFRKLPLAANAIVWLRILTSKS